MFEFVFRDITIERSNANGSITQTQTVPILFSAGEHYIDQTESDPQLTKTVAINLPRMGFDLINVQRNPNRQVNPLNKIRQNNQNVRFVPTAYDIYFELYLKARNTEDAFKVIEQIIPYFQPYLCINAAILDGFDPFNIIITLNSVVKSDRFEGHIADKRDLQYVVSFTVNGWFFGPNLGAANNLPVIRWVNTTLTVPDQNPLANADIVNETNTFIHEANVNFYDIQPTDPYTIITDVIQEID